MLVRSVRAITSFSSCRRLLRQYLYFCTSKARKLSTECVLAAAGAFCVSTCTFVLRLLRQYLLQLCSALLRLVLLYYSFCVRQHLYFCASVRPACAQSPRFPSASACRRRRYLYSCTRKASKLSTACVLAARACARRARPFSCLSRSICNFVLVKLVKQVN